MKLCELVLVLNSERMQCGVCWNVNFSTQTYYRDFDRTYSQCLQCFFMFHYVSHHKVLFFNTMPTCSYHLLRTQRFTRHSNRSRECLGWCLHVVPMCTLSMIKISQTPWRLPVNMCVIVVCVLFRFVEPNHPPQPRLHSPRTLCESLSRSHTYFVISLNNQLNSKRLTLSQFLNLTG